MNPSSIIKLSVATILVIFLISSCIPSLHPIYTDITRTVDDRLLGMWNIKSQSPIGTLDFDLEITPEGDSTIRFSNSDLESEITDEMLHEAFKIDLNGMFFSSESVWKFERASKITFEKKSTGTNASSISMTLGARSFAPEGYQVTETEDWPFYILTHQEIEDGDTTTSYLIVNMTEIGGELYLDFVPFPKGDKRRRGAFAANYINGHTFAKVGFKDDNLTMQMFDGGFVEDLIKSRKVRLRHEKLGIDGDIVLTASTQELRAFIKKYGRDPELFESPEVLVQI